MKKRIVRNEKLQEKYYYVQHPSGLTILLYPMPNYSSAYALFGTRLGSIDMTFKSGSDQQFTVVPEGVAHFLEHKLFESEDGDAFSLFAKTGASANAFTSFDRTCYLFSTTNHFKESLKSLLTFVQSPYFTQETVEKEQGIIGQEIKMYEDNPGWRVFFNLLGCLYHNHPVKIDIAGTVESIAKIDAKLLYKCYHTFYNLNNMVLAIAGNFSVQEAEEVIEANLKDTEKVKLIQKTADEPDSICEKECLQKLSVSLPLFQIGFKETPYSGMEWLKAQMESEILLEMLAGEGSLLYRRLYDAGLIHDDFGTEVFSGRGYFANIFAGESKDPKKVQEELLKEIRRLRKSGLSEQDFLSCKKSMYGRIVRGFNKVESVANGLVSSYFADVDIYDNIKVAEAMSFRDIKRRFADSLDESKMAISVIEPLE
ncbi:EF-P 5-aminopentanol modification-associated protein YfmH [Massiliimalia timonensis]|uniref:EF-P 5-aminopentanol modification-associated protein YfmH n=1 Tax=Massiliimalia timonensis TaxID=1987501 RepID=UPI000B8AB20D|nr:pitrilysin family protein [Massiliimalia timonensis]